MRFWQVKLQLEGKGELESELSDCCSCCSCYCYCCYCCCWSINNPLCKGLSHCSFTYFKCTLCFLHTQFAINLKQLCCPPCKRTEDPSRSAKKNNNKKPTQKKTLCGKMTCRLSTTAFPARVLCNYGRHFHARIKSGSQQS